MSDDDHAVDGGGAPDPSSDVEARPAEQADAGSAADPRGGELGEHPADGNAARATSPQGEEVGANPLRPMSLHARRVAPVLAVAALLIVVAVAVVLVRYRHQPATVATGPASSPLYLVPDHVPEGLQLAAAVDTTSKGLPAAAAVNGEGLASFTTDGASPSEGVGGPTTFVFGNPHVADPLDEPMIAVVVSFSSAELGTEDGAHDVTRNGRTIRLWSKKWWGPDQPDLVVASMVLPEAGGVSVAGRNLDEDQLANAAAALQDVDFRIPLDGSARSPATSPQWQAPILAALPAGSELLQMGSDAMRLPVTLVVGGVDTEKGTTALLYTPSGQRSEGRALAVTTHLGGDGRLAADRFFHGYSERAEVAGHEAWVFPAAVENDAAMDASAGYKAVEWVQGGHVVRVEGNSSIDEVTAVAASLREVSAEQWKALVRPVLIGGQEGGGSGAVDSGVPSDSTEKVTVATGENRGVRYTVTVGVGDGSPGGGVELCIDSPRRSACVGQASSSSSSSGSFGGPDGPVPTSPMPTIPYTTAPAGSTITTAPAGSAGDPGSVAPALPSASTAPAQGASGSSPSSLPPMPSTSSDGGTATSAPGLTAGSYPSGAIASFVRNPDAGVLAALALPDVVRADISCLSSSAADPVSVGGKVFTPEGHPGLRVIVVELPAGCTPEALSAISSTGKELGTVPLGR